MKYPRLLCLLLFLSIPFPRELLHHVFRHLTAIVPHSLSIPESFYNKISFFPAQILLGILLFCIVCRKDGHAFFWSGPSKYLTLLGLACFFSLGASSASSYPLIYVHLFAFCLSLSLFPLVASCFDAHTIPLFLKRVSWGFFGLALFESSVCLLQYFAQAPLGLKLLGEGTSEYAYFHVPLECGRWIFDILFHKPRESVYFFRALGTFPHPNICGAFLFVTLLFTFYLYFHASKARALLLFGLFVQVMALTTTFCRAAIIAVLISTLFWFCLQARSLSMRPAIKQLTWTLAASYALCALIFFPQLSCRGGLINYNAQVQAADGERLSYQKIACKMVQKHPLFGVGFDQFEFEAPRFFPEGKVLPFKVHNIYLLIAAETGLAGVLCFFLFLLHISRSGARHIQNTEGLFLCALFIGLLWLGCCDFYFLVVPHCQILFFGIAALFYANTQKRCVFSKAAL